MNNRMSLIRREAIRALPFLGLFGLTLLFYRGDYEQIIGAVYIMGVIAFVALVAHYFRKTFFPYADLQVAWSLSLEAPLTAAMVFIAMLAFLFGLIWLSIGGINPARAEAAEPSALAQRHLPVLVEAFNQHWPDAPYRHYAAGQIEQESGWKERAELKTSREYGFGLGQITQTSRFDNFREAQKLFPAWRWEDRFNVRYQLGYAVITDRANFKRVSRLMVDDDSRWRALLVAYNAGFGTVLQRRALAIRTGAPHDRWAGGLETVALPYEDRLLYGRRLADRRNEYPRLICDVRAPKYRGWV